MSLSSIGMSASRSVDQSSNVLSSTLEKMAAGKKNLSAKDDPAATVLSALLSSQLNSSYQAVRNNQETSNVLSVADGGLSSIASALQGMRSLALHAANSGVTSSSQVSSDQAQLNGQLNSIANIAGSTSYAGSSLFNGSRTITATQTDTSGSLSATQQEDIVDLEASSISTISGNSEIAVSFSGNAADQAEKAYVESDYGSANISSAEGFRVEGNLGKADFSFSAGTSVSDMADAINAKSETTGVSAYLTDGGTNLRLTSQDYGSDQSVKVTQTAGDGFADAGESVSDRGQDLTVSVNGERVTGDGLSVQVSSDNLTARLDFSAGTASDGVNPAKTTVAQQDYAEDTLVNASAARSSTLDTAGTGMKLQSGITTSSSDQQTVSLPGLSLNSLGKVTVGDQSYSLADLYSGGSASLASNPTVALKVIDQALSDITSASANVGAYQSNVLQSTNDALSQSIGNTTSTLNDVSGVDIASLSTQLAQQKAQMQLGLFAVQNVNENQGLMLKLLTGA